ncbi:YdcF family protein [Aspergillus mulundensis]|uniref:DUF218 domain-containing protein n=1 Tax=Aspergillus mulundensis TaxID=1810919 RepID=A0A3D8RED6_9EURO|nr:hypothetical protein DSM5745_07512 [Aspergillus mulundensis]RDW72340.1 hypothetical protein DSM5745_07512 [Aspergillus mulundensis]
MAITNPQTITDINLVAGYLANQQIHLHDLPSSTPVDCIVLCASMILHQAESLFHTLQTQPPLTKTLVLCGGIGHSTQSLYEAVAQHPRFSVLSSEIKGLPEARVLEKILDRFFDRGAITQDGRYRILVEDQSTNCGQNAAFTRLVLEDMGIHPQTCVVIQDPTMMLRTKVSFQKVYEDTTSPPSFVSCPVLAPRMSLSKAGGEAVLCADCESQPREEVALWPTDRFLSLVMGEIPRLEDDEGGYGPRGRGFIPHVDVPVEVEEAWTRLRADFDLRR